MKANHSRPVSQGVIKILLLAGFLLVFLPVASAAVESFGNFEQNKAITLIQTWNGTICNITSITAPNSNLIAKGLMTKNGNQFSLSLAIGNTSQIGDYNVCGDCDSVAWCAKYSVTPTGFTNTLGFYIVLFAIAILLCVWGYSIQDTTITSLGGMGLIGVGLYTWIEGIAGIRDTTTVYIAAVIIIFSGVYVLIRSAMEAMKD